MLYEHLLTYMTNVESTTILIGSTENELRECYTTFEIQSYSNWTTKSSLFSKQLVAYILLLIKLGILLLTFVSMLTVLT